MTSTPPHSDAPRHAPGDGREIERETLAAGNFLALQRIRYRDPAGRERYWETAERLAGRRAVMIVPTLWPHREWILVRQYRPPAGGTVIEFPAGLIEDGESPEDAALRELAEETGYTGAVRAVLPPAFSSPGLSGEAVHLAFIDIDGSLPENALPRPRPDEGEFLDVLRVPFTGGRAFLEERAAAGERFDGKVIAYFLGWAHSEG